MFASLLLKRIKERKLREAASVCRFSANKTLWAVLAGFCLESGDLNILEDCYKATGHFDKLDQIDTLKNLENKNTKNAEVKMLANDKDAVDNVIKRGELLDSLKVR